jgi:DNA-binding transcriptional LysR family regulator
MCGGRTWPKQGKWQRMSLDLFRLRVFVTVVDRDGYSSAARQLHLAQSTVSHHVSELERECGAQLLRYQGRKCQMTSAGEEVYRAALVMLAEQERLAESLGDLKVGRRGRVRLGASLCFEHRYFFDEIIAPFCRSHEGTMLSMNFGHSRRLAMAVLDRTLDLAYVIRWHLPGEVNFEFLQEAELAFLASRDHPLASKESVTLEEVGDAGLITAPLTDAESFYYREVLRERGVTGGHSVLEVDGQQTRFLAAASGLGVVATFIPKDAPKPSLDGLTSLRVEGPLTTVELGLVRRPGDNSSSADGLAAWLASRPQRSKQP